MHRWRWVALGVLWGCACSEGGTAGSVLEVVSTTPRDGSTSVPTTATISVVFSKAVRSETLDAETFRVTNLAPERIAYDSASRTATYLPASPLMAPATYVVTLTTGIRAADGATLREPFRFTFSTGAVIDTTPPQVVDVQPGADARGVPVATTVRVRFSEPVNDTTWAVGFRLVREDETTAIAGSHSYSEAERMGIFTPQAPLSFSTTYVATVTQAITDRSGNLLPTPFTWRFTTEAPRDTRPPVVSANPPAGIYNSAQQVALTADEPAQIFWTTQSPLDVPTPNEPYTGPLSIGAGVTILRFRARDDAGNVSNEASERYVIDTQPPATSIAPAPGVYTAGVNIELTATDNFTSVSGVAAPKIYYLIQDSPSPGSSCPEVGPRPSDHPGSTLYASPFALPVQAGQEKEVRICYRAIDAAGNREALNAATYRIDTLKPRTLAIPAPGVYSTVPLSVTFTAVKAGTGTPDAATVYCARSENCATYPEPQPCTSLQLPEGRHCVRYFAVDEHGNAEDPVQTGTWIADETPPTAAIVDFTTNRPPTCAPGTACLRRENLSLTFQRADNIAAESEVAIYYSLASAPGSVPPSAPSPQASPSYLWSGAPIALSTSETPPSVTAYTLKFFAVDPALNRQPLQTAQFVIDKQPPTTAVSRPSGTYNMASCGAASFTDCTQNTCPVTLTADDPAATIRYILGGSQVTCSAQPCTVALPHARSPQSLTVWATDAAGNQEAQRNFTYGVDVCPPGIPQSPSLTGGRARLQFNAPGDDLTGPGAAVKVHSYEIALWRPGETPGPPENVADFDAHLVLRSPCPQAVSYPPIRDPAQAQALTVPAVEPRATYRIAVRAVDAHCNRSRRSDWREEQIAFIPETVNAVQERNEEQLGVSLARLWNVTDTNAETGRPMDGLADLGIGFPSAPGPGKIRVLR